LKNVIASLKVEVRFECPHCGEFNVQDAYRDTSGDNDLVLIDALYKRWSKGDNDYDVDTEAQNVDPFICYECVNPVIFTNIEW